MRTYSRWIHDEGRRVLINKRSKYEVNLRTVGQSSEDLVECIFRVHNYPWGDAKTLDELIELLDQLLAPPGSGRSRPA